MNEKEIMKDKRLIIISIIVALILGLVATLTILFFKQSELNDVKAEVEDLQFKLDSADAIYKITSDAAKKYMDNYIDLHAQYTILENDYALMEKKYESMKDERNYYRDMAWEYECIPTFEPSPEMEDLINEALKGIN